jgi:RNA-directed DNA polymerase
VLGIQRLEHLAQNLGIPLSDLLLAAEYFEDDIEEFRIWNPDPTRKPRDVIQVTGNLRKVQELLYNRILKTKLSSSEFSHGGIAKRHILSNALTHLGNRFLYLTDIADFFPSITNYRVNRLFLFTLKCSPEVARLLTRICTYRYHLALGLVTSPCLADQVLMDVDRQIAGLCKARQIRYSRFVDNITVSADFDLDDSTVPAIIRRILGEHGFKVNAKKDQFGKSRDGMEITGICIDKGRPDVAPGFVKEIDRILDDHEALANDGEFVGPYLTSAQVNGKVQFACWVNPNRRFRLLRRFRNISWDTAAEVALRRGLMRALPRKTRRDEPRPSFEECYGKKQLDDSPMSPVDPGLELR